MKVINWQHEEESDHFNLGSPSDLTQILNRKEGGIYLKCLDQKLALEWNAEYSVLTHQAGEASEFTYPMTLDSLERTESDFNHDLTLQWVCGCCGVSLGDFPIDHHLPRQTGLSIFRNFLELGNQPMEESYEEIIWTKIDV